MKKLITCTHCKNSFEEEYARRACSNCFACTGCERYICTYCNELIVIKDIKKISK